MWIRYKKCAKVLSCRSLCVAKKNGRKISSSDSYMLIFGTSGAGMPDFKPLKTEEFQYLENGQVERMDKD